jgi:hypothetical protein
VSPERVGEWLDGAGLGSCEVGMIEEGSFELGLALGRSDEGTSEVGPRELGS